MPNIEPKEWQLRIHGMVERDLVLSFDELVAREISEDWITLNCVSNEVGGDLIGNAWWSGVRLADILEEAGVSADADAMLQTSEDGWTCGTPLVRAGGPRPDAMLAVFMNGEPLTVEHGFPVRTIVPGLYGYVSACKWVVDMEVTPFDAIEAYWTGKGWSEEGPVKISSRIDVPDDGEDVPAGDAGVRRHGLEAAHRDRAGRGVARRRRVDGGHARPGAERRHLGAVAGRGRRRRGGPRAAGARDRQ